MMQLAKRYVFDAVTDLQPTTGGTAMPFASTFMLPGIYTLDGQSWDCTLPGLYRFKILSEAYFRNRIVWGGDLYAVLSAISWNHVHGTAHEQLGSQQAISDMGRYAIWRMRCGYIGNFLAWLLPQWGYSMKQVGVHTLGALNGYDDEHQVIEVLVSGKWLMFDVTNGCYWKNANGDHMSTADFIAQIANNGPMPQRMDLDGNQRRWDNESIPLAGGQVLDMGLYGELLLNSPTQQEAWFRRIFQAINT